MRMHCSKLANEVVRICFTAHAAEWKATDITNTSKLSSTDINAFNKGKNSV